MSPEQASQISDLASYCQVTGQKRFKRTKEEMSLGLTPEQALKRRLSVIPASESTVKEKSGNFTISIIPEVGVDADYFEHVTQKNLAIRLDNKWYAWYDELLAKRYDGDATKLIEDILNKGIGEVISCL